MFFSQKQGSKIANILRKRTFITTELHVFYADKISVRKVVLKTVIEQGT